MINVIKLLHITDSPPSWVTLFLEGLSLLKLDQEQHPYQTLSLANSAARTSVREIDTCPVRRFANRNINHGRWQARCYLSFPLEQLDANVAGELQVKLQVTL